MIFKRANTIRLNTCTEKAIGKNPFDFKTIFRYTRTARTHSFIYSLTHIKWTIITHEIYDVFLASKYRITNGYFYLCAQFEFWFKTNERTKKNMERERVNWKVVQTIHRFWESTKISLVGRRFCEYSVVFCCCCRCCFCFIWINEEVPMRSVNIDWALRSKNDNYMYSNNFADRSTDSFFFSVLFLWTLQRFVTPLLFTVFIYFSQHRMTIDE